MNTNGTLVAADGYFEPRETAWFRTRLALRLAVPVERGARVAALKLAASAALAAPPVTIVLIAPMATLTLGSVTGLLAAGLPGFAATAWTAAGLRESRLLATRGLRQAGAEQRTAWLIGAARLCLFAGIGALAGSALVALTHATLGAAVPDYSPLHRMFAANALTWLPAITVTTTLAAVGALLASSPLWEQIDWSRFARGLNVRALNARTLHVRTLNVRTARLDMPRFKTPLFRAMRRSRPPH
ncbi:MAG TPA: hypothetical protein VGS97_00895 [Actinocrinis sp.]|uniref:hypothetical protein n=1 Tax=Actinocrinis sp. TaxID=1920516 RepID=UPI002DDD6A97|nr:hypothetical protein [Actinocrinis sp.]HEV2342622.1 hypothetical protein [Actinocrinis sp.]